VRRDHQQDELANLEGGCGCGPLGKHGRRQRGEARAIIKEKGVNALLSAYAATQEQPSGKPKSTSRPAKKTKKTKKTKKNEDGEENKGIESSVQAESGKSEPKDLEGSGPESERVQAVPSVTEDTTELTESSEATGSAREEEPDQSVPATTLTVS